MLFRLPNQIPAIVDGLLKLGLTQLWVQQGIVNLDEAEWSGRGWDSGGDGPGAIMVEHRRRQL